MITSEQCRDRLAKKGFGEFAKFERTLERNLP